VARSGLKTICVDLPDYTVSMLEDLSKLLNITPSQLLAKMLHPIYEVWRAGREADVRTSTAIDTSTASTSSTVSAVSAVDDINKVVEAFIDHYRNRESRRLARIGVEGFLAWLSSKGTDICTATAKHIDQYMNEVVASRFFSQRTVKSVAGSLHSFLAFAKPRLCKHSAKMLL
jgi:phosphoglycolate phosphatase-like HAD superfamily hydrolase